MKALGGIAVATLAVVSLMWGSTDAMAQECNRGGNHTIQVVPGEDGSVCRQPGCNTSWTG